MDFRNATIKYYNSPDGSGDRTIEVVYPVQADGKSIQKLYVPIAEDNTEYIEIMKWVAEGNTIEEAD
jgi:hypothetical protein